MHARSLAEDLVLPDACPDTCLTRCALPATGHCKEDNSHKGQEDTHQEACDQEDNSYKGQDNPGQEACGQEGGLGAILL